MSCHAPFEHPLCAEQPQELEEDVSALRKYRCWIIGEVERCQAIRKPCETPCRPEILKLLEKGKHLLKETKRRSERVRTQTRVSSSVNRGPEEVQGALVGSLGMSEHDPTEANIPSDTKGTQTIKGFIRDVVNRKQSKSKAYKDDGR